MHTLSSRFAGSFQLVLLKYGMLFVWHGLRNTQGTRYDCHWRIQYNALRCIAFCTHNDLFNIDMKATFTMSIFELDHEPVRRAYGIICKESESKDTESILFQLVALAPSHRSHSLSGQYILLHTRGCRRHWVDITQFQTTTTLRCFALRHWPGCKRFPQSTAGDTDVDLSFAPYRMGWVGSFPWS